MKIKINGMGLAGAWCAYWLVQNGYTVEAFDLPNAESSTRIAAGLITPITGQRVKPTWKFNQLFPFALKAYASVEKSIKEQFDTDVEILKRVDQCRIFRNQVQADYYLQRRNGDELSGIDNTYFEPNSLDALECKFGGFITRDSAVVDLPTFLFWIEKLVVANGGTVTKDVCPDHEVPYPTITCSGWQTMHNELWRWLPLETSKGEIIDVTVASVLPKVVVNCGTWIVPGTIGGRVGATNDWDDVSPLPTHAAGESLKKDAERILGGEVVVVGHRAAIRPSTQFKRPLVGVHPLQKEQYVCTGFGAKGTLQGPWAANQLVNNMINNTPINEEIDVCRWWIENDGSAHDSN